MTQDTNQGPLGQDIQTGEIDNGAITAAKLATDAVETAKIKDANVTLAKLNADAISSMVKIAQTIVSGSDVTSVDFTSLDIDTDGIYIIEYDLQEAGTGAAQVEIYVNDDTASYDRARLELATGTGSVNPDATFIWLNSGDTASGTIKIFRNVAGHFSAICISGTDEGASISGDICYIQRDTTDENITKISLIATTANAIKIGSKFTLYKLARS